MGTLEAMRTQGDDFHLFRAWRRDMSNSSENPWVRIASSVLSASAQFPFNKPIANGHAGSDAYPGECFSSFQGVAPRYV